MHLKFPSDSLLEPHLLFIVIAVAPILSRVAFVRGCFTFTGLKRRHLNKNKKSSQIAAVDVLPYDFVTFAGFRNGVL